MSKLVTKESYKNNRIPKGPSIFYFIARRHDMSNPHKILHIFQDIISHYGKICTFRSGLRERTYLVADPLISNEIFTKPKLFPKYPELVSDITKLQSLIGKGLLATHSDDEWYEHRKQMVGAFKPNIILSKYHGIIIKHLNIILDKIKSQAGKCIANFSEIGILLSGRIISEILSPFHDLKDTELLQVKHILDKGILEFHSRRFKNTSAKYKKEMLLIADRLLISYCNHKEKCQDSLIARMIKDFPNAETSTIERQILLERLLNIIIAGYETTATTISWIFYLLAKHPNVVEQLYSQINFINVNELEAYANLEASPLLENTIKEAMRIYPALWFNIRYCANDVVINGIKFKKNSRIMLLPFISNNDSAIYSSPEKFTPDRFVDNTLSIFSFGHGPRLCMGKALAEMEIKTILAKFLQNFKFETVNHPKPIGGVLLQPNIDIKVKLINRNKL